jgi:hypothetical protein
MSVRSSGPDFGNGQGEDTVDTTITITPTPVNGMCALLQEGDEFIPVRLFLIIGFLALLLVDVFYELSPYGSLCSLNLNFFHVNARTAPTATADIREIAAHYATALNWVYARGPGEDGPLFSPEDAVTLPLGDGHRFRDGCGTLQERAKTLSLRWREAAVARRGASAHVPRYPSWNRRATCETINGRAIIVVGDSLSAEFYDTLVSALRPPHSEPRDRDAETRDVICSGRVEEPALVQYVPLKDKGLDEAGMRAAKAKADTSTLSPSEDGGAQIIWIMNRGAWYRKMPQHLQIIKGMMQLVKSLTPNSTLFWRTTPVGHPDAFGRTPQQNAPPLDSPIEELNFTAGLAAKYMWWEVQSQNEETVAALPSDVIVVDVVPATALRHDSHPVRSFAIDKENRDGLHYCIPGPVDQWVELWAAILRALETKTAAAVTGTCAA